MGDQPTPNHGFVLHGTEIGAWFNLIEPSVTLHGGDTDLPTTIPCEQNDGVAVEQRAFLCDVRREKAPVQNTVEEALDVQRLVDGIYRSAVTGHAIRLNEA